MATIGIDFGTTKTLVSYFDKKRNEPRFIRLGNGRDEIPTSLYFDANGAVIVGEDALDRMLEDPRHYACGRNFKLGLGNDDIIIGKYTARDLTRIFLQEIKKRCENEKFHGETIDSATITVPVKFLALQREELKIAAEEAGFKNIKLLKEPEAAGRAFLFDSDNKWKNIIVLDWGGGTVDIAFLSLEFGKYKCDSKFTWGNDESGGELFDELLVDKLSALCPTHTINERDKRHIKTAKENMSTSDSATLRFVDDSGIKTVGIKKQGFEKLIASKVAEAATAAKELIKRIPQDKAPEAIVLIGGSSKIPFIKNAFENETGLPCEQWHYSDEAVAAGASIPLDVEAQPTPEKPVNPQPAARKEAVAEDDDFVVVNEAPRINIKTESYADSKNVDKQGEYVSPSNDSNDVQKRAKVAKDNDGCWSLLCRVIGFICIFFCLLFAGAGFYIICSIVINIVKTIFSN